MESSKDDRIHPEMIRLREEGDEALRMARYPEAIERWSRGLTLAREAQNTELAGVFLANLGLAYFYSSEYDKALRCLEQALAIHRVTGGRGAEAADLRTIGLIHYSLSHHDRAIDYYNQAFAIYKTLDDRSGNAIVLTNIGLVYYAKGDYDRSLGFYDNALSIFRDENDRHGECVVLRNIGLAYHGLCKYSDAIDYYERSLTIAREIADKKEEAINLNNIGLIYDCIGQYDKALDYLNQALNIHRELGNKPGESANLNNIGILHYRVGRYAKASTCYRQAVAIRQTIGDVRGTRYGLNNIGLAYYNLGQYDEAFVYYEQALALYKGAEDRSGEGSTLANIGILYDTLGLCEEALRYFEAALAIRRDIKDRGGEGNDLTNIGQVYDKLGQYEKARGYFEESLAIHKEVGDRREEANDLASIGLGYYSLHRYEDALGYLAQALAISREIEDKKGEGGNLTGIGRVYAGLGRYGEADQALGEGLRICMEVGAPELIWSCRAAAGQCKVVQGDLHSALTHYREAADTIELMRATISDKEAKASFMGKKLFVYDELIGLLNTMHRQDRSHGYDMLSFEVFERKQGRIFLEEMGRSGANIFADLPRDVRENERELESVIEKAQSGLSMEKAKPAERWSEENVRALIERIEQARAEQSKLKETIRSGYPDYHAIKYPQPSTVAHLQEKVLRSGEVVLAYAVTGDATYLWAIGKDRFGSYRISLGEKELEEKVEPFRAEPKTIARGIGRGMSFTQVFKSLILKSRRILNRCGRELFSLLIPDDAGKMLSGAGTIYVCPTYPLDTLPFEALVSALDGEKPRYLVEDHSIAYLSSASLLGNLREARARRGDRPKYPLVAFADPVYGSPHDSRPGDSGLPVVPPDRRAKASGGASQFREMRTRTYTRLAGGEFNEMPETAEEAREIKEALGAPDESRPLQLREAASRSNVFEFSETGRLCDYRYIVFACHGVVPEDSNQMSQPALVLSNPDPKTGQDGFLTMADVFGLKLNASLVTLSACKTGLGKLVRGEGVMALTRAFMYAGTPAVTVTLWAVQSESAKALGVGLYTILAQGRSRANALREAKLRMIRGEVDELHCHPFYWAPMVVFGDGA